MKVSKFIVIQLLMATTLSSCEGLVLPGKTSAETQCQDDQYFSLSLAELEDSAKSDELAKLEDLAKSDEISNLEKPSDDPSKKSITITVQSNSQQKEAAAGKCVAVTICGEGEVEKIAPTATSDRQCIVVDTEVAEKELGDDVIEPLLGKEPSPDEAKVCAEGEYQKGLADDGQPMCAPLTACALGETYEIVAPTATSDRQCHPVSPPCHTETHFVSREATLTSDRQCSAKIVDVVPTKFSASFAALKSDGSVVTWGTGPASDSSSVKEQLASGVSSIVSSLHAYAALKSDGSLVTWGDAAYGGDSSAVQNDIAAGQGLAQIIAGDRAFAGLTRAGTVVAWGSGPGGNIGDARNFLTAITDVYSLGMAGFAARKDDGRVISWANGQSRLVGSQDLQFTSFYYTDNNDFNTTAVAALNTNGGVATWGAFAYGGDSINGLSITEYSDSVIEGFNRGYRTIGQVSDQLASGVQSIAPSAFSGFAALKNNGSVVLLGGHHLPENIRSTVLTQLSSGVTEVSASLVDFAALKQDGTIFTWGSSSDTMRTQTIDSNYGIQEIFSGEYSFAGIGPHGSGVVFTPSEVVRVRQVEQVFINSWWTHFLTSEGGVIQFGGTGSNGGYFGIGQNMVPEAVRSQVSSGVVKVFANRDAVVALKADGSLVLWGDAAKGGAADSSLELSVQD